MERNATRVTKMMGMAGLVLLLAGFEAPGDGWTEKSHREKALNILKLVPSDKEEWRAYCMKTEDSGVQAFHVVSGKQELTVKVFSNLSEEERTQFVESYHVASINGYGPKVFFANVNLGVMVMEYVVPGLSSLDKMHIKLGKLLNRVHNGQTFGDNKNANVFNKKAFAKKHFKDGEGTLNLHKICALVGNSFDQQLAKAYDTKTNDHVPCLGNITLENVCVNEGNWPAESDNRLYVVDFDSAGWGDKYYDIAAGAIFYCWNDPQRVEEFVTACLGNKPTEAERAKLNAAIRFALIYHANKLLTEIASSSCEELPEITETYGEMIQRLLLSRCALSDVKEKLKLAILMLKEAVK